MGSSFSSSRTPRFLIGDISRLPVAEQKLFSLSNAVLDKEDPNIGKVFECTGVQIVWKRTVERSEEKSLNGTDTSCTQNNGTALTNCGDIILNDTGKTDPVTHLFSLPPTDKPFYFSQTFSQWKAFYGYENLFSCCLPLKTTIYIAPLDNFPDFIREFEIQLDSYKDCLNFNTLLQTFAEAFFDGVQVRMLPAVNLLEAKWNIKTRIHSVTKQKQYYVREFHRRLKQLKPPDGLCIMGFIWTDLYPTESLNFVLGEADNALKSGIFCFGRFEPKSFDPETHSDITEINAKIIWRILKVFSHELCHLFGLRHCWYFDCAMNESNSMEEAFSQPIFLCPVCLRKLQYVLDFNVIQRYQKLLRVLTDLCVHFPVREFKHAVHWLELILKYLKTDDT